MAATLDIPAPTHREQQPPRRCPSCGAWMRSYNESSRCDPCGVPPWENVVDEVWERLPEARSRQRAFEALEELMAA